jgi:hypothetical protein
MKVLMHLMLDQKIYTEVKILFQKQEVHEVGREDLQELQQQHSW